MTTITNIEFSLEGHGQVFSFTDEAGDTHSARLQLPSTPDSIHLIDNAEWDENDQFDDFFNELRAFFYASFSDSECAKFSCLIAKRIERVQSVTVKNRDFYVGFEDGGTAHIAKEGRASDYYNVFYFENVDISDLQYDEFEYIEESEILSAA